MSSRKPFLPIHTNNSDIITSGDNVQCDVTKSKLHSHVQLDRRQRLELWKQQKKNVKKSTDAGQATLEKSKPFNTSKRNVQDQENMPPPSVTVTASQKCVTDASAASIKQRSLIHKNSVQHKPKSNFQKRRFDEFLAGNGSNRTFKIYSDDDAVKKRIKRQSTVNAPNSETAVQRSNEAKDILIQGLHKKVDELQGTIVTLRSQLSQQSSHEAAASSSNNGEESRILLQKLSVVMQQNEEYMEEIDRLQEELDMKVGEVKYFGTLYNLAKIELQEEQDNNMQQQSSISKLEEELGRSRLRIQQLEKELKGRDSLDSHDDSDCRLPKP